MATSFAVRAASDATVRRIATGTGGALASGGGRFATGAGGTGGAAASRAGTIAAGEVRFTRGSVATTFTGLTGGSVHVVRRARAQLAAVCAAAIRLAGRSGDPSFEATD